MKTTDVWEDLYTIQIFNTRCCLRKTFFISDTRFKNSMFIIFLFGILPAILFFLTSYIDGSIYLPGERGLIQDYIFLSYFVFIPALFLAAMFYFPAFPKVLHTLQDVIEKQGDSNDLKVLSKTGFEDILRKYEAIILGKSTKWFKNIAVLGGFCWVILGAKSHWFAFSTYSMDIWSSQNYLYSFIVRTIYEGIVFGILFPLTLFKFIMILYTMRSICRTLIENKAIRLRALNPDKAGGLGRLGKYSLKLVVFLIPPLIPILTYLFMGNVTTLLIVGVSLYIPLLIFTFFFPLSGAHDAMKNYKGLALKSLSREFNRIYDGFIDHITDQTKGRDEKIKKLAADSDLMEKLDELYQKAEQMPVWPFDTNTITKFLSLIGLTLFSIWFEWILNQLIN